MLSGDILGINNFNVLLRTIHSFHWQEQNETILCRSQQLLPFLPVIYIFLPLFPTNYSTIFPKFILPYVSWSTSGSCLKYIYNTLLWILFFPFSVSSVLALVGACTFINVQEICLTFNVKQHIPSTHFKISPLDKIHNQLIFSCLLIHYWIKKTYHTSVYHFSTDFPGRWHYKCTEKVSSYYDFSCTDTRDLW